MRSEEITLAQLVRQAEGEGATTLTLQALVEEASELGAGRALERLGLADAKARKDLDEMRDLLCAWRDAKRTARDAVIAWLVRVVLAAVMLGLAVKLGFADVVRG